MITHLNKTGFQNTTNLPLLFMILCILFLFVRALPNLWEIRHRNTNVSLSEIEKTIHEILIERDLTDGGFICHTMSNEAKLIRSDLAAGRESF